MLKVTFAKRSADNLVGDLQSLYSNSSGLLGIMAMDLLKDAVAIQARLGCIILTMESEAKQ